MMFYILFGISITINFLLITLFILLLKKYKRKDGFKIEEQDIDDFFNANFDIRNWGNKG